MKTLLLIPMLLSSMNLMAADEISVKAAGLQVVWEDGAEYFNGFKTFNSKPGVNLALILETKGDSFVDLDQNESKVIVGGVKGSCWFFGSGGLSEDAKHLKLKIGADGAKPSDGKVEVKGDVVVMTASGKGELSSEMIEWKKNSVVKFPKDSGLPDFKVGEIGKPDWGDEKWEVTLKTKKDFEKFVSVKFVDEKGKEFEGKRGGWSRMGMLGKVDISVSYKVKDPVKHAKMVVEYWKGVKKVKVPVNMTIGMDGVSK